MSAPLLPASVAVLLGLSAAAAFAQPVSPVSSAALAAPPAALEQTVALFLQQFISPDKSPEAQAEFFADGVDYYEFGPTARSEIVRDVRHYSRRWPVRNYRLARIEYITPDPASDSVFVSYVLEYEVSGPQRSARGQANYGAVIADLHSEPKIEWIRERVVGKRNAGTE
ncbi:hypothetical protein [Noviherbaspirillum aerium]|uniref:hypothetical protein n=1 Tax=Noviherbaspirillum aerium TaxID=2588497 RepID=UPI00124F536C|nr:hypothetical protein [Noviherbaspirillum aerium]